jgi:Ca2+-binding RTX toxin-like protein
MAVFQFSALSDGQAISFNPDSDVLNFDRTDVAAAQLIVTASGGTARIEVAGGPQTGKDVTLLNTAVFQLTTTNITFADGSLLVFGDNSTARNDDAANTLIGGNGRDLLSGFDGNDSLNGGAGIDNLDGGIGNDTLDGGPDADRMNGWVGNDTYIVTAGDVLTDPGGVDTVLSDITWTLADGFENLTATGTANVSLTGNNGANVLTGNAGNNFFNPRGGDDTIQGGAGNDQVTLGGGGVASYGSKVIDLGAGFDRVDFSGLAKSAIVVDLTAGTLKGGGDAGQGSATLISIESVTGDAFDDRLSGSGAADSLNGGGGNDTLDGRGGNDTLTGGLGADTFVFSTAPGFGKQVSDFLSGTDKLSFDNSVFTALGTAGNFAAGDARFAAGPGLTSGHDADDRLVYNTTTGQLFYDGNGNGPSGSTLVGTLQGAPALAATDIVVTGQSGSTTNEGTQGNDTLTGTPGDDTIDGLGGNDLISGLQGNDSLIGGAGDDTLDGGPGGTGDTDTLDGGLGNDVYALWQDANDVVADAGGVDTIVAHGGTTWILPAGLENLVLTDVNGFSSSGDARLTGNELNNVIRNEDNSSQPGRTAFIDGADGDDTLIGGTGQDHFLFAAGSGSYGNDSVDGGGSGIDDMVVGQYSAAVVDFRAGTVAGGGTGGSGSVHFANIGAAFGGAFDDRLAANDSGVELFGGDGSDTMLGGAGDDILWQNDFFIPFQLASDTGDDQIFGGAGNDSISGWRGNNLMDGGTGDDLFLLDGVRGRWGADTITGGDGADGIGISGQQGAILVDLSSNSFTDGGPGTLTFSGVENFTERTGANFDDHIIGNAGANRLEAMLGNDLLEGGAGNDTLIGGGLDDFDPVGGNNTLDGGLGDDSLVGTREIDNFLFHAPSTGVDRVSSFATSQDKLVFDNSGFTAIGSAGTFGLGDARFFAGAGATSGHDANDRIVYDTSTGNLYYDADGSGAGAAQLVATLEGRPVLAATDIAVVGSAGAPGATIVGTAGNDSLTGTDGNDTLDGGAGTDTMNGGLGNDTYIVTAGDVLSDPGGIDTVLSDINWFLDPGFENLTATGSGAVQLTGTNEANVLTGNTGNNFFNPRGGDDTIQGGAGNDQVTLGGGGVASYGSKVIDLGAGFDRLDFSGLAKSALVVDLAAGTLVGGGTGGAGSAQLIGIEQVFGDGFNDRLSGSAAAESLNGGGGNDTLDGRGGNDTLTGGLGADAFVFDTAPGAGNVDLVTDFVSATDKLTLENGVFTALGAAGDFVAGDVRFAAGAGFTSGRDASDRIVYDTTTGNLYYDADGNGAGAAQLFATIQGHPAVAATDITVI